MCLIPFANLSGDPQDEYFGDGLAEEITNVLAQIGSLKVIVRTSAFAFKGKNEEIRKIADTLTMEKDRMRDIFLTASTLVLAALASFKTATAQRPPLASGVERDFTERQGSHGRHLTSSL